MIAFVQSFGLVLFEITSSVLEIHSAVEYGGGLHLFPVLELCPELLYSFRLFDTCVAIAVQLYSVVESGCIAMLLFPVLVLYCLRRPVQYWSLQCGRIWLYCNAFIPSFGAGQTFKGLCLAPAPLATQAEQFNYAKSVLLLND